MTNIFPLNSSHIGRLENNNWDLEAVSPLAAKIIIEDISSFGIEIVNSSRQITNYMTQFTVVFSSEQDLNYYKLAGNIKEGTIDVFSDSGMIMTFNIIFAIGTEIYA